MARTRPHFPAARSISLLLACFGICLAALSALSIPASASSNTPWLVAQIATAKDGTSRVLLTAQTNNGEVVSIWKLNAAGSHVATSQAFGPYTDSNGGPWTADSILPTMEVAGDGTTRLLWTAVSNAGTAASVWSFDSNMNKIGSGQSYGPYGDWVPTQFLVAADGTERLLWTEGTDSGGTIASIWNLNSSGVATSMGASYGPFTGSQGYWTPLQLAVAPDGTSRLLWVNDATPKGTSGDQISFWTLNSSGVVTHYGTIFGPNANWWVDGFDISKNDSKLHLLWYNDSNPVGDQASAWTLDTIGSTYSTGPIYGPYSGWFAYDIFANANGTAEIKWNQIDLKGNTPAISIWSLDSGNKVTSYGTTYGPFDGWTLYDYERNSSSANFNLLWQRTDNAFSVWSLNSTGTETSTGSVFGPYTF